MIYLIVIIFSILLAFYTYIYLLKLKIVKLENKIKRNLNKRTNLVPSIYEVTKDYLNKHSEIFNEIIKLRKTELLKTYQYKKLEEFFDIESLIHHELDFIFKVTYEKPSLQRDSKFLYLKELLSNISYEISENIKLYNNISIIFNKLIKIKNYTIL
jgi:hypothetical protein